MKLLRSLTFRLALYYAGLFTLSVLLLGALYYVIAIRAPLESVERGLEREARELAALHETRGMTALAASLDRRAGLPAPRLAYHVLLDADGRAVTANLPSWPREAGAEWIRVEADLPSEGDEDEHEALVNDRTFADGSRLLIGAGSRASPPQRAVLLPATCRSASLYGAQATTSTGSARRST